MSPLMNLRPGWLLGLGLWMSIVPATVLEARGFRVSQVPNGEFFGCALCHQEGGGNDRNVFGQMVEDTLTVPGRDGDVDWLAIFDEDADGDGFTNGEEMRDADGDSALDDALDPSHPGDSTAFPGVDVVVFAPSDLGSVEAGASVELTIDVFNDGSREAAGVVVDVTLPPGGHVVEWGVSSGDCAQEESGLSCDLLDLPPRFGQQIVAILTFDPETSSPAVVEISASLATGEDIRPSNNSTSVEIEVLVPPEGTEFHRGDPNGDGPTDVSDALFVFGFLFLGGPEPQCLESADANNDGAIDISDGVVVLAFLFTGGPPPAAPGPAALDPCGLDTDDPGSSNDLGCEVYASCFE